MVTQEQVDLITEVLNGRKNADQAKGEAIGLDPNSNKSRHRGGGKSKAKPQPVAEQTSPSHQTLSTSPSGQRLEIYKDNQGNKTLNRLDSFGRVVSSQKLDAKNRFTQGNYQYQIDDRGTYNVVARPAEVERRNAFDINLNNRINRGEDVRAGDLSYDKKTIPFNRNTQFQATSATEQNLRRQAQPKPTSEQSFEPSANRAEVPKSGFELAVEGFQARQQMAARRQKRIENTANLLTGGYKFSISAYIKGTGSVRQRIGNAITEVPVSKRGRVGRFSARAVEGFMSLNPMSLWDMGSTVGQKAVLVGQGFVASPKNTASELFIRAPKATLSEMKRLGTTAEGLGTLTSGIVTGRLLKGPLLKSSPTVDVIGTRSITLESNAGITKFTRSDIAMGRKKLSASTVSRIADDIEGTKLVSQYTTIRNSKGKIAGVQKSVGKIFQTDSGAISIFDIIGRTNRPLFGARQYQGKSQAFIYDVAEGTRAQTGVTGIELSKARAARVKSPQDVFALNFRKPGKIKTDTFSYGVESDIIQRPVRFSYAADGVEVSFEKTALLSRGSFKSLSGKKVQQFIRSRGMDFETQRITPNAGGGLMPMGAAPRMARPVVTSSLSQTFVLGDQTAAVRQFSSSPGATSVGGYFTPILASGTRVRSTIFAPSQTAAPTANVISGSFIKPISRRIGLTSVPSQKVMRYIAPSYWTSSGTRLKPIVRVKDKGRQSDRQVLPALEVSPFTRLRIDSIVKSKQSQQQKKRSMWTASQKSVVGFDRPSLMPPGIVGFGFPRFGRMKGRSSISRSNKSQGMQTKYTPTAYAASFNLYGKKLKGTLSGLEFRGLMKPTKEKSKRKDNTLNGSLLMLAKKRVTLSVD